MVKRTRGEGLNVGLWEEAGLAITDSLAVPPIAADFRWVGNESNIL